MTTKTCGIYRIVCVVNGKVYIGSSGNIEKRFKQHVKLLKAGNHHSAILQHAWDKHGSDKFKFEIIECVGADLLLEREQYWMDHYLSYSDKHGYNISVAAGASMRGRKHSAATKERFSETRQGSNNPNWRGRVMACKNCGKEFKDNSSKGRPREFCCLACYWLYWPTHMTEARSYALGSAMRGKKRSKASLDKYFEKRAGEYTVTDPSGNVYDVVGLARFCREHNLDQGTMSKVALGQRDSYKGWKCKRVR